MREAVFVSAVRSGVGKVGGGLAPLQPWELAAQVVREAVKRARVDPSEIDEVIYGSVTNKDMFQAARIVSLEAGIPKEVPGISIDRQCGTSLNAAAYAAILIQAGVHDIVLAGGVEMDSRRPWLLSRVEKAFQMQPPQFLAPLFAPPSYGDVHVLKTAEKLAGLYGITRQECDQFALNSQKKAARAWEEHRFDEQVFPVTVPGAKGKTVEFSRDETIRPGDLETLGRLRVASGVPDGVVTAGNSSPTCDGASALVVMEKKRALSLGCEILGAYRGYASVGVDPSIMGIGPVYAVRKLLNQTGLTLSDIDLFEINEAFASQSIACVRELGLNEEKLNVNGGAIALGHPMGATGGILTAKMLYELGRREARYGMIAFCCGGGQGVAMLIER